jgi:CRISPR-associated protein Csy2
MAINMFAHNLGRNIDATPDGVAIIHHDHQMLGDWITESGNGKWPKYYLQQRRGASFIDKGDYASGAKGPSLSLQPTASCHLCLSLVFKFTAPFDFDEALQFIDTARIAGGQVTSFYRRGADVFDNQDELIQALPKTGYWITDRMDLLEDSDDPLSTLLECVTAMEEKQKDEAVVDSSGNKEKQEQNENEKKEEAETNKKKPEYTRKYPWLTPTVLGYATITNFEERENVRTTSEGNDCLHAFAEPMIGPVQYVSMRKYKGSLPFWRHQWLNEKCFVVNQVKGDE